MLDLEFSELSDSGRRREHNEDAFGHVRPASPAQVQSQGWFFALADGVGGHERGEVASQLAIQSVLEGFRKIPKGVMHVSLLPRLIQEANAAVYDANHDPKSPAGSSMGSTIVTCALRFDSAVISHVGDSRAYLFRGGAGGPLTRDHTMAAEQFRLGIISQSQAETGGNRHVLTRCLGNELFVAADTVTVNIQPGDTILLCSDGLSGYVPDAMILHLLNVHPGLDEAAKALVAASNEAGGHDNVTVQLIRIKDVERMGTYRGRPYRLL